VHQGEECVSDQSDIKGVEKFWICRPFRRDEPRINQCRRRK